MFIRNRVRNSLRFSFLDGLFASCMLGLTTDYITPYALYLKATASQVGILAAAPNLIASLVQLKSADLTERLNGRKRTINLFVFLHALMLLPIILTPYLLKKQHLFYLVIFFTLFTSLNAFAAPVWSSLMSEYIPYKMRGKYFGWRNKVLGIVTIVSAFAAGIILTHFRNNILTGFSLIFFLAFLSRLISWYFLTRMYEPVFRPKKEAYFSLFDFLRRAKESNFARFVIFVASLNFCVHLASPFFSVFMLKDLKFNYLTYTLVVTAVSVAGVFTIDRWGKIADKIGNLKILKTNALIISSLPLWWIFNQRPGYLICIQILSGFAWAGFNLCAVNFIYDAVTPQKRIRCIAYFNVFSGVGLCLGAVLGGALVNNLPLIFKYRTLTLFLVSSILRFFVVFLFYRKINEVRTIEKINSRDLFYSVLGIKPI